jgi:hypothetical protein
MGTFCRLCVRFCAVTTISSTVRGAFAWEAAVVEGGASPAGPGAFWADAVDVRAMDRTSDDAIAVTAWHRLIDLPPFTWGDAMLDPISKLAD